ncbi:MAG: hypothetical protein AAGH38_06915 [Pseudomonadota bacterium]
MSWIARAGYVLALGALTSCSKQLDQTPMVTADACSRVALVDVSTGNLVVGAEDLAVDPAGGRLFLSAYDRRAVEKAVAKRKPLVPEGGVYEVSLEALHQSDGRLVSAKPLIDRGLVSGGLRPHGLDFDPVAGEVAFINRSFQRIDGKWLKSPRIERVSTGALPDEAVAGVKVHTDSRKSITPHCASNDLISLTSGTLVSNDHGACGWRATLEDVFSLSAAGVSGEKGKTIVSGLQYANGITQSPTGEIAVASTRGKKIALFRRVGNKLSIRREVDVPGGPDNLTTAGDGSILAAVHPSLLRFAAHRHLGFPEAPTRIVQIDPYTLEQNLVFDDKRGSTFSGATVAVKAGSKLILGAAIEPGLLVCDLPAQ